MSQAKVATTTNTLQEMLMKKKAKPVPVAQALIPLTGSETAQVTTAYAAAEGGNDLAEIIRKKVPSATRAVCAGLATPPLEYDVELLHEAMDGFGTDEETLVDVLTTRHPGYVARDLAQAYAAAHGRSLMAAVADEVGGMLGHLLEYMLDASRFSAYAPDATPAADDAARLAAAIKSKKSIDAVFVDIFAHRPTPALAAIAFEYAKIMPTSLDEDIEAKVGGNDLRQALLNLLDPGLGFARAFANASKSDYPRLLIRASPDALHNAPKHAPKYKKKLTPHAAVQKNTSGDLRTILAALCDGRPQDPDPEDLPTAEPESVDLISEGDFDDLEGEGEEEDDDDDVNWDDYLDGEGEGEDEGEDGAGEWDTDEWGEAELSGEVTDTGSDPLFGDSAEEDDDESGFPGWDDDDDEEDGEGEEEEDDEDVIGTDDIGWDSEIDGDEEEDDDDEDDDGGFLDDLTSSAHPDEDEDEDDDGSDTPPPKKGGKGKGKSKAKQEAESIFPPRKSILDDGPPNFDQLVSGNFLGSPSRFGGGYSGYSGYSGYGGGGGGGGASSYYSPLRSRRGQYGGTDTDLFSSSLAPPRRSPSPPATFSLARSPPSSWRTTGGRGGGGGVGGPSFGYAGSPSRLDSPSILDMPPRSAFRPSSPTASRTSSLRPSSPLATEYRSSLGPRARPSSPTRSGSLFQPLSSSLDDKLRASSIPPVSLQTQSLLSSSQAASLPPRIPTHSGTSGMAATGTRTFSTYAPISSGSLTSFGPRPNSYSSRPHVTNPPFLGRSTSPTRFSTSRY